VTPGGYTRYTLRLPRAAATAEAPAAEPPPDDWSGSAAFVVNADPVDYAHPDAVALVASLQPAGWQEEDGGDTLVFWVADEAAAGAGASAALAALAALGQLTGERQEPGWETAWQEFHRPQTVGRFYVRPPWSDPQPGLLDLVIDAGQAFGTGGHATTRQCLEELQGIAPAALLDIGCGSGVVSLAALRLGFAPVWGVDIDPASVRASAENAEANGLAAEFSVADATDPGCALPAAGVVVANIALGPILRLAARFAGGPGSLAPGHLLLAGLLVEQAAAAAAAYPAYREVSRRDDGEWALVHLVRAG
jgi:ribosomal protein L11 methyltransferase